MTTVWLLNSMAAVLGVTLGAIVFRVRSVRGELFALLTLAVTFVLATIVLNTPIDGGPGVYLSGVAVPALAPTPSGTFYVLALVLAVATLMIARSIAQARLGLGLFAIHDDEDAAEVMGVPTYRYKLVAFGVSCGLAGIAGGIHALFIAYVTAGSVFNITVPLTVVLMSVLGGTRHWAGPALGATAITLLLYASTAAEQAVAGKAVTGAILVAAVLFMARRRSPAARPPRPRASTDTKTPSWISVVDPVYKKEIERNQPSCHPALCNLRLQASRAPSVCMQVAAPPLAWCSTSSCRIDSVCRRSSSATETGFFACG